jgi:hypothetical protein
MEILMKAIIVSCAALIVGSSWLVTIATADAPKQTEAQARAKIEAQALALAQAKCAKDGKVALAQHVNKSVLFKCVSSDDPDYKAQESAKPAQ